MFYTVCIHNASFIWKRITKMNLYDIKWTVALHQFLKLLIHIHSIEMKTTIYPYILYFEIKVPYIILFLFTLKFHWLIHSVIH